MLSVLKTNQSFYTLSAEDPHSIFHGLFCDEGITSEVFSVVRTLHIQVFAKLQVSRGARSYLNQYYLSTAKNLYGPMNLNFLTNAC